MIRRTFPSLALLLVLAACDGRVPGSVTDRGVSEFHFNAPPSVYPTDLLVQRKEGRATVECLVTADGTAQDCQLLETVGGDAFGAAALDYVSHRHYLPAVHDWDQVPRKERRTVTFALQPVVDQTRFKNILMPHVVIGSRVIYPPAMLQQRREGGAEVTCRITIEGFAKDCLILASIGGSAFADAALDYAAHLRYAPELNHGVPVEVQHELTVDYRLDGSALPPGIPDLPPGRTDHSVVTPVSAQPIAGPELKFPAEMVASGREGLVGLRCAVTVQGTTRDCRVIQSTGDRDFEAAALDLLSRARFAPATSDGQPVEVEHKWTLYYGDR